MSSLVSGNKIPASVLVSSPQSDIFPGMVKISATPPASSNSQAVPEKNPLVTSPEPSVNMLLPLGIAAITGLAVGRGTAKMIERPIDNLPAGLIGAAVCGAAVVGTTGFYIAQYGGFFDKDRDFKTMFKNL